MSKVILLLLALAVTVFSVATNCNENAGGNGLEYEDEDLILELDDAESLAINPDCLKKNVCITKCPCGKNLYFEIKENHPLYNAYLEKCQKPHSTNVVSIVKQEFSSLKKAFLEESPVLEVNTEMHKDGKDFIQEKKLLQRFEQVLKDISSAQSKMDQFIKKIKKLCTKEQTNISPEEQLKTLFNIEKIGVKGAKRAAILKTITKIIKRSSEVLGSPCDCSTLNPSQNLINQVNQQCSTICK